MRFANQPTTTHFYEGWHGSPSFRDQMRVVHAEATSRISGVPFRRGQDAEMLIESAGGTVLRVESDHLPPNPHQYPHINYTTSSGARGTIRVVDIE